MSRSELERLARIRMQVTGETLERAMAVLGGQTPSSASPSEPDAEPDPAENGEVSEAGTDSEGTEDRRNTWGSGKVTMPDGRRTPQKRNHLRGL
ncbi:hypothetical protein ACGFWI_08045 [Streptomyces sp. NPDC048434]|uniref:hypothetical protein n=1 Tax=Streptomyces sp. NPDC048434 TaxID=3365549 RepID=UPI003712B261